MKLVWFVQSALIFSLLAPLFRRMRDTFSQFESGLKISPPSGKTFIDLFEDLYTYFEAKRGLLRLNISVDYTNQTIYSRCGRQRTQFRNSAVYDGRCGGERHCRKGRQTSRGYFQRERNRRRNSPKFCAPALFRVRTSFTKR